MNLIQYYYGFKDFGCSLQTSGSIKLRSFKYRKRDLKMPIFQCMLINKGCHSDSDSHIGGEETVTYCQYHHVMITDIFRWGTKQLLLSIGKTWKSIIMKG